MTIGSMGVRQATTYFIGKQLYPEDTIKRALVQVWMLSTILSSLICFVLIMQFSKSADSLLLVILAIVPIPFNLFNTYNSGIFLGKNNIKTFNKINWLPTFIIFVGSVMLVIVLDLKTPGAMVASVLGPLVMTIILLFRNKFINSFSFIFDRKVIKALLSLGMIYAISMLVINLNYKVNIFLLDNLSTKTELGIYSRGSQLMEYLWEIPMLLSTIILSRSVTSKDSKSFSLKVAHLLRLSIFIVGVLSIVLFFMSKWIIVLLFGEAFERSSMVQQILMPGVVLLTIFKVLNVDLSGRAKPWVAVKAMLPALVINVLLNLYWIPNYGANGAAASSTISYSISALLFLHFYSREVDLSVKEILKYSVSDFDFIKQIINQKFKQEKL